jgi:hypothetical protein
MPSPFPSSSVQSSARPHASSLLLLLPSRRSAVPARPLQVYSDPKPPVGCCWPASCLPAVALDVLLLRVTPAPPVSGSRWPAGCMVATARARCSAQRRRWAALLCNPPLPLRMWCLQHIGSFKPGTGMCFRCKAVPSCVQVSSLIVPWSLTTCTLRPACGRGCAIERTFVIIASRSHGLAAARAHPELSSN